MLKKEVKDDEDLLDGGRCDPLCSTDELSSAEYEDASKTKTDAFKALTIGLFVSGAAIVVNHSWVAENQEVAMGVVFLLGYAGIVFEESLAFNKAGVGLLMAVFLWVIRSSGHCSGEVAEIVFFLLGAMTIVEIVDAHQGFRLVTDAINTRSARKLLWLVGGITFFLSSVLDNLTSTIVMVSLLRKLVADPAKRSRVWPGSGGGGRLPPAVVTLIVKFLGAVVVIAANAGGAWTPIGDVTTTMLWIHGHITTLRTMQDLLLPSFVSLVVPLALFSLDSEITGGGGSVPPALASEQMAPRGRLVFGVGVGTLLFVPVFKAVTGLPPYLGMLGGLGTLWLLTDAIHYGETEERQRLKVPQALSRIDTQGVLFFLGILLSVGSLEAAGVLKDLAVWLDVHIGNVELIATAIGLASAVVDNVPLVAATMGMYDPATAPIDAELWQLIAYCAGTGGSILIIGSAAGVAFMGMEKADFFWYLKKVSGAALAGYLAGIAVYLGGLQFQGPLQSLKSAVVGYLPQLPSHL
eukprot:jgi/Mesen1/8125/ME000437S07220